MPGKTKEPLQLLQRTLDLIVLRTLSVWDFGTPIRLLHALQLVSDRLLALNQGTLYPGLVRLEQYGWTKGTWGKTEKMSHLVEQLLIEEPQV
jgi:DNA-binding PadR family transcriptional regulator